MMAGNSISLEEMATEIEAALEEYSEEVTEETKRVVKQVAKNAVAKLKQTSPKKTGVYAKGWTSKVAYESSEDIRIQVYNRKKPQLTSTCTVGRDAGTFSSRVFKNRISTAGTPSAYRGKTNKMCSVSVIRAQAPS